MRIYTDIITCIYKKLSSPKPSLNASSVRVKCFCFSPKGTFPERQHHDGLIKNPSSMTHKQVKTAAVGKCKLKGQIRAEGALTVKFD